MSKVDEIMNAVRDLTFEEYLQLRTAMDALDEAEWEAEREKTAQEFQTAGMTDEDIDRAVVKRRYESRP